MTGARRVVIDSATGETISRRQAEGLTKKVTTDLQTTDNVEALFARNAQLLASNGAWAFPQGAPQTLYTKHLEHVPFLVTGDFRWATKEASTIKDRDANGNIVGAHTIQAQECVEMTVRLIGFDDKGNRTIQEPKHAILQGMYLLNQLRSLQDAGQTGMLQGGYVWTVRRNEDHITVGGGHPFMLALFDPAIDEAPSTF